MMNKGNPINIGIIGSGDFGLEHIRTIQSLRGVNLFGVCDNNRERLKRITKVFNVNNTYINAEDMLKEKLLDGVIIATDEKSHVYLTEQSVAHGKHVLLEKPVATSIKDANNLVSIEKDSDTIIMPGHMLRFDPAYVKIKEALGKNESSLQSIKVKRNVPIERFTLHSRTHPVFMALSHDVDQIIWNTSSLPKRIYGMQRKTDMAIDSPGIFFGLIEMENGLLCSLETQWCLPNEYGQYLDVELEAMMEEGHLKFRYPGDNMRMMINGKLSYPDIQLSPSIHGSVSGALRNEIEHFIQLIERKEQPVITMNEASMVVKICEGLIRSAEEKREIQWEEL